MWHNDLIVNALKKKIDDIAKWELSDPPDDRLPVLLAFLGAMEIVERGDFYGSVELSFRGISALNPRITAQTTKMSNAHPEFYE